MMMMKRRIEVVSLIIFDTTDPKPLQITCYHVSFSFSLSDSNILTTPTYLPTYQLQGFVRAMQYFDNIIIAVATLLEPMIATLIAVAIGVGELPGLLGWMGNLLVVVAVAVVTSRLPVMPW